SGIPGWVDKQAFIAAGINGIDKPKESEIILVKTQKGWKARGL
ncbi:DNA-directed RNA polymerase subunit beta, partial [Salmonella enterica]|nr:DNA-directed RNA polymerase subunit beta [Salmonella enterica]